MADEHAAPHGGAKPAGRDAAHWDQRYADTDRLWSAEPNAIVEQIVADYPPGTALDVGTGEGRHAVWLAQKGWRVTAVDFSAVGVDRGRQGAAERGVEVDWVLDDIRTWRPPPGTVYDLVLVAYLHLSGDVLAGLGDWVAPGGHLVILGHALRNLADGVGGPQDATLLHTEEQLRGAATGLRIDQLGEILRPTPDGDAIDLLLVARR